MVRTWGPEGPGTARGRSTPLVVAVVLALALTFLAPPTAAAADTSPGPDPLGPQQWYLSWKEGGTSPEDGRGTVVGVIDTGIDSTHPDLDDAYDAALSRSFVEDRCGRDPYCTDPGRDLLGHGTAVAGIIAAALDGHGIGGAAPGADLVSLKAGDASGYFSADAVSRAIRYGADAGLDVLVMSFTVDPWFRYCDSAPGDTDEERARQREDRAKIESALQYASDRGVVMVAAAGNESYDLDGGTTDGYSAGHARSRGGASTAAASLCRRSRSTSSRSGRWTRPASAPTTRTSEPPLTSRPPAASPSGTTRAMLPTASIPQYSQQSPQSSFEISGCSPMTGPPWPPESSRTAPRASICAGTTGTRAEHRTRPRRWRPPPRSFWPGACPPPQSGGAGADGTRVPRPVPR